MTSGSTDTGHGRSLSGLATSVEAAATAATRLARASLRISVEVDSGRCTIVLRDSGERVRDLSYDELFETLALPPAQLDRWVSESVRGSRQGACTS